MKGGDDDDDDDDDDGGNDDDDDDDDGDDDADDDGGNDDDDVSKKPSLDACLSPPGNVFRLMPTTPRVYSCSLPLITISAAITPLILPISSYL